MAENSESEEKESSGIGHYFGGLVGRAVRALSEGPMRNITDERTPNNGDDEGKGRRPNNQDD